MKKIKIIIASLLFVACSKTTFAQENVNQTTDSPLISVEDGVTPVTHSPSDELILGPLLDLHSGGQSVGVPQPKTVKNPDGTTTVIKGSLKNGTLLPEKGLGFVRGGRPDISWGAGVMISLIINSAAKFTESYPDSVIRLGSIAMEHGGEFAPHKSHQSGLDADFLFLGTTSYASVLDAAGNVTDKFDPIKNWDYWRMLVSQQILVKGKPTSVVSMILVHPNIKTFLCDWTKAHGLDQSELDKAVLTRLRPTAGHDNHFHLRVKCSPHYPECIQQGDYYKETGCEQPTS